MHLTRNRNLFQIAYSRFLCSNKGENPNVPRGLFKASEDVRQLLELASYCDNTFSGKIFSTGMERLRLLPRRNLTISRDRYQATFSANSSQEDNDKEIYDSAMSSDNLAKTIKRLHHLNLSELLNNQNIHTKKALEDFDRSSTQATWPNIKRDTRIASVLIPFCKNMDNEVSILFTLRASRLNKHGGEISFPGGQQDPEDKGDCLVTARRETREELNINDNNLVVIGQLNPVPSRYGTAIVPVLGQLNVDLSKPINTNINQHTDQSLSSSNINNPFDYSHCFEANADEVERVYVVPLRLLYESRNWHSTRWKNYNIPTPLFWMRHPVDRSGELPRIWGVTGAILYICLSGLIPAKFSSLNIY